MNHLQRPHRQPVSLQGGDAFGGGGSGEGGDAGDVVLQGGAADGAVVFVRGAPRGVLITRSMSAMGRTGALTNTPGTSGS